LALQVYTLSADFPKAELFGLTSQLRRAAVSSAANIVEGCARSSEKDLLNFLSIAYGSLAETGYLLSLAHRLGFLQPQSFEPVEALRFKASKTLAALIKSLS